MNTALWIIQILLILLFMLAGFFKLIQTREKILASGATWAEHFSTTHIKVIGLLECLLSVFMLINLIFSVSSIITLICSIGMGVTMLVAAGVHVKRKEYGFLALTVVTGAMAFFLVYENFILGNQ